MNTKKLFVGLLLTLTLIVGAFAVYLTISLNNSGNTNTPTPTPTVTVKPTDNVLPTTSFKPVTVTPSGFQTSTPIPTITSTGFTRTPSVTITITTTPSLTPTVSVTPVACGNSCEQASCISGSSCLTVNGSKRCVSNTCFTAGNPPVMNNQCNSDLCTVKTNLEIVKTATLRCQGTSGMRQVAISIKVTNPYGSSTPLSNIRVVDSQGNPSLIQYYTPNTINNGGKLSATDNTFTWENQSIGANGASLELYYNMSVPASFTGRTYATTVSVYESNILRGSTNYNVVISVLPCTALTDKETTAAIAGIIMVLIGLIIFRFNWNQKIGNFIWNKGGKNLTLNLTLTKKDKFERALLKDEQ